MTRSAREVFDDHLARRLAGKVDEDIASNYSPHVVLLTGHGVFRGHDGVRECASRLEREMPHAELRYIRRLVDGEIAFLEWSARSGERRVEDGADTFYIRDGRILVQTVHYTVT